MVQWLQFKYKLVKLHCSKSNRRSIAIHTRNCIDTCSTDIINISLCHSVSLSLLDLSHIFSYFYNIYIYISPSLFVYLSRSLSCTDILVFEKKNNYGYLLLCVDIRHAAGIVHQSSLQIDRYSAKCHDVYGSFMYTYIKMNFTKWI